MLKNYSSVNKIKRKIIYLKQSFLILLFFLSINSTPVVAQNNYKKSPTLELLLIQIEKNYLPPPWNIGIKEIAKSNPQLYAILLGSAMRKQENYLNQFPGSTNKFNTLNTEIISLISKITKTYNISVSNNNKYIKTKNLEEAYYSALMGKLNSNFKQEYKKQFGNDISQVNIPFILNQIGEPIGKKTVKKEEKMILLGVVAPIAKDTNNIKTHVFQEEIIPIDIDIIQENNPHEIQEYFITNMKCPLKNIDENGIDYIKIDTNNNPNDKTYVLCEYDSKGLLNMQTSWVNGFMHGEQFKYHINPFHIIIDHEENTDTEKYGILKTYRYWEKETKTMSNKLFKHDVDIKPLEEEYYLKDSLHSVLDSKSLYLKGKKSETTWFYEDGQIRRYMSINIIDSTTIKEECWDIDGMKIPCQSKKQKENLINNLKNPE